jgi:hypothetical protein
MKNKAILQACSFVITGLALLALAGCNFSSRAEVTPTLDSTQAFQTVQANLTEAVARTPSVTPTVPPTETSAPTATATTAPVTPTATISAVTATATSAPASNCDQASPGSPIDVTIPDDTEMVPGQVFTKTWRLVNAGTCTWNSDYDIVWFSGERMGAPESLPLEGNVAPGETVDISVDMTAPLEAGTFQSNWKLRNASGQLFGIGAGEGLPFYVRIIVSGTAPTVTVTAGPTATTQPIVSGSAILFPGDRLDLDAVQVNAGGGDLVYNQGETEGSFTLAPLDSALLAVSGGFQPGQEDCRSASLSAAPVEVNTLVAGTYLCYRTSAGNIGWLQYTSLNPDNNRLDLTASTWISAE